MGTYISNQLESSVLFVNSWDLIDPGHCFSFELLGYFFQVVWAFNPPFSVVIWELPSALLLHLNTAESMANNFQNFTLLHNKILLTHHTVLLPQIYRSDWPDGSSCTTRHLGESEHSYQAQCHCLNPPWRKTLPGGRSWHHLAQCVINNMTLLHIT